jgi:hypothetical protein
MTPLGMLLRGAVAVVPLTLVALALFILVIVAGIWPTPERKEMVKELRLAIKDLGSIIAAGADRPAQQARKRRAIRPKK